MRHDPHGVQEFTAYELHPDDAVLRIVGYELLEQQQMVGKPCLRMRLDVPFQGAQVLDQLDPRPGAALFRLQERREPKILPGPQGADIVERHGVRRADTQSAEKAGLCAFGELEGEDIRSVDHSGALVGQRTHEGERERNGSHITPEIRARTCLIEVHGREGELAVGEGTRFQVDRGEARSALL